MEKLIIPTPLQIDVTPDSDLIVINNDWMVECSEDFKKECDYLEGWLLANIRSFLFKPKNKLIEFFKAHHCGRDM